MAGEGPLPGFRRGGGGTQELSAELSSLKYETGQVGKPGEAGGPNRLGGTAGGPNLSGRGSGGAEKKKNWELRKLGAEGGKDCHKAFLNGVSEPNLGGLGAGISFLPAGSASED